MNGAQRLTSTLVFVGAIVVAISYFLPYEGGSWSHFRMARGYCAAGGFMGGWNVALFESASYLCALIVALAFLLRRYSRTCSLIILTYLVLWMASAALYCTRFFNLPAIRFPTLWAIVAGGFLLAIIALAFSQVREWGTPKRAVQLTLFAAAILVVYHAIVVVYIRVEDKRLLDYGAITTALGAVVLLVALLFQRQLIRSTRTSTAIGSDPAT